MQKKRSPIWQKKHPGIFLRRKYGEVICADALEVLNSLHDNSIDLIFLDPPFNIGKQYGKKTKISDKLNEDEYIKFMTNVLDDACRVLKEGGSLFVYHMPKWAFRFAAYLDNKLDFQHSIAISMKNGFVRGPRLYPAHYSLLHFSKGPIMTLKRPKIPIKGCRHCGKDVKDYGGYRKYLTQGLNLSDIWDDISPVRHKHKKHRKANELPQIILDRVLKMCGSKKGILLDPFAGSGTSLIAAKEFGMKFIGCDREKEYFSLMSKRIEELKPGVI